MHILAGTVEFPYLNLTQQWNSETLNTRTEFLGNRKQKGRCWVIGVRCWWGFPLLPNLHSG